jgi:hypothetical protein
VPILLQKGLPTMKLAIRAFAFCIVLAGAAAATLSSPTTQALASNGPTPDGPIPICGPWAPCLPNVHAQSGIPGIR